MDDATFEATIKRIDAILLRLIRAVALDRASIRVVFERDRSDCDSPEGIVNAEMHPNWQYATGTMVIYVAQFADKDDDEIARVLLHELGHYWLHPLSRYGESKEYDLLEERICTDLAQAFACAIRSAGEEIEDRYRLQIKRLEKEVRQLKKDLELKEVA